MKRVFVATARAYPRATRRNGGAVSGRAGAAGGLRAVCRRADRAAAGRHHVSEAGYQWSRLLVNEKGEQDHPDGLRVDAIGGVLLISATGPSGPDDADRLEEHLERAGAGARNVVVDLTGADVPDQRMLQVLRRAWQRLGDRLRVVAPPSSEPAAAIKREGLRRFAVHATLSGALTQAGGGRRVRRFDEPRR
jgi:hypothetical protein